MADDVRIAEVAFNGSDLPKWSTEKTLQELLKQIEKTYDLEKSQLTQINNSLSAIASSTSASHDKLDDVSKELNKSHKYRVDEDKKDKKDRKAESDGLRAAIEEQSKSKVSSALNKTADFGTKLGLNTSSLSKLAAGFESVTSAAFMVGGALLSFAGWVVGSLWDAGKKIITSYLELYKSGLALGNNMNGVANGMTAFTQAAINGSVTIADLTDLTKRFGVSIRSMGIENFGAAINDTFEFVNGGLNQLGLTSREAGLEIATQADRTRQFGVMLDVRNKKDLDMLNKSIVATTNFARSMGMATEELENAADTAFGAASIRNSLESLGEGLRQNAVLALTPVLGVLQSQAPTMMSAFGDILQAMSAGASALQFQNKGIVMLTVAAGQAGSQLADSLRNMAQQTMDGLDPKDIQDNFDKSLKGIDFNSDEFKSYQQRLSLMAQKGDQGATQALQMINQARDIERKRLANQEALSKGTGASPQAVAAARLDKTMNNFSNIWTSIIQGILGNDTLWNTFNMVAEKLNKFFDAEKITKIGNAFAILVDKAAPYIEKFANWIISLAEGNFDISMDNILGSIGTGLMRMAGNFLDWIGKFTFGPFGAIVGALSGFFLAMSDDTLSAGDTMLLMLGKALTGLIGLPMTLLDALYTGFYNLVDEVVNGIFGPGTIDTKGMYEKIKSVMQDWILSLLPPGVAKYFKSGSTETKSGTEKGKADEAAVNASNVPVESKSNTATVTTKSDYKKQQDEQIKKSAPQTDAMAKDSQINTVSLKDLVELLSDLLDQNAAYSQGQIEELEKLNRGISIIASKD
jgi:hypothetical protein